MRYRLSKILHYLGSKLKSIFEFIQFVFVPRKKYFIIAAFIVVGVSVFFAGRAAYAIGFPTWDDIMHVINLILYSICWVLGVIAMKIFALVIMVSQYNTFVTSPAVTKAWVLVRDVCNMGFVVILLVIAFAQILNVQKYSIKTLLPRVLLTAVLINFSKLLCGLMIDIAQVVMLTFVNGFQATAGANLINGLGLDKLLALSKGNADGKGDAANAGGITNGQVMLALFISIFLLIAMCFVMFFIALLLLLRIVTLWLLVILSPAAWAFGMLPMGSSKYGEWWQKFGWNVAVGPFMAFFLWISLLIMSNPTDMLGNLNDMTAGIEAKGGEKMAVGYLDNLAQAAIGLALLMASLIAAQEAGGTMQKLASKGQAVTTGALKWSAGKLTGATAIADRGKAVYQGFAAKQAEKKAMVMDKWQQKGADVFAAKEKTIGAIKHPVATMKAVGAAVKGGLAKYKENRLAGGGVFKSLAGTKKAATKAAQTKYQADTKNSRRGSINKVMAARADAEIYKKRQEEAKENMAARGITDVDELKDLASGKGQIKGSEAERKNALLMLAEKGELDEETAKLGKNLMSGDDASEGAFEASMKKKQVHLAYNFDDPAERAKFDKYVKSGDLDLTKQGVDAYKDPKFMGAAAASLGAKAFGDQMKKVGDRSEEHKDAVKNTVKHESFAPTVLTALNAQRAATESDVNKKTAELADLTVGSTAHTKKQQELDKAVAAKSKADAAHASIKKSLPEAIAKVSGDLDMAFVSRDDNGVPHPAGHPNAGIDNAALAKYVKALDAKELAKLNLSGSSEAVKHGVASNINANTLNNLAKSNAEGVNEQVQELTRAMAAFAKSDALDPATHSDVEIQANEDKKAAALNELLKAVSKDETSAAFGGQEADILRATNEAQTALNSRRAAAGAAPVQSAAQQKTDADAAAAVAKAAADVTSAANAATAAAARDAALAQAIADAMRRGGPPPPPP